MNRATIARDVASPVRLFAPPIDAPLLETVPFAVDGKDFTIAVTTTPHHAGSALSVPGTQLNTFFHFVPVRR